MILTSVAVGLDLVMVGALQACLRRSCGSMGVSVKVRHQALRSNAGPGGGGVVQS